MLDMLYPMKGIQKMEKLNNKQDWQRVLDEGWYRIPVKHAPEPAPQVDIIAFYFMK